MSAWRARWPATAERPVSVGSVVRRVRASLRATHAVECVLLFAAGVMLARGASLLSGVSAEEAGEAWAVALFCGVLSALSWWLEHPVGLDATARALDQRLRHQGALVTAYELEGRRTAQSSNSMEKLVRRRVLERLRPAEAIRALFPPLLLPIGAPTLAALAWLLIHDAQRPPAPPRVDLGALAEGLERSLALGALDLESTGSPGEASLSAEQRKELKAVARGRRDLPFTDEAWSERPGEARARLEELDRRVAELSAQLEPGSEVQERLEEARTWLDALRMGLPSGPADAESRKGEGTRPGGGTGDLAQGTISRPLEDPAPHPMAPDIATRPAVPVGTPPRSILGRQAGNWWPGEYDAVVERWIELSREERSR